MRLDLDPATLRRARLVCSAGAAWPRLWGHHWEEWLARFAAHEGGLPFTYPGALCALLADVCCSGRDDNAMTVLYQRFSFGPATARPRGPSPCARASRGSSTRLGACGRSVRWAWPSEMGSARH